MPSGLSVLNKSTHYNKKLECPLLVFSHRGISLMYVIDRVRMSINHVTRSSAKLSMLEMTISFQAVHLFLLNSSVCEYDISCTI